MDSLGQAVVDITPNLETMADALQLIADAITEINDAWEKAAGWVAKIRKENRRMTPKGTFAELSERLLEPRWYGDYPYSHLPVDMEMPETRIDAKHITVNYNIHATTKDLSPPDVAFELEEKGLLVLL